MENTLIKETLQNHLASGTPSAMRFLYTRYSSMLFGYVLQFIPDKNEAEKTLIVIFGQLANRVHEASQSASGIYCWMQAEARKIILEYTTPLRNGITNRNHYNNEAPYYLSYLREATDEQKKVFREMFFEGRSSETVAQEIARDVPAVKKLLHESLLILRKNML